MINFSDFEVLNEIGDGGAKTFDWKMTENTPNYTIYELKSGAGLYYVNFQNMNMEDYVYNNLDDIEPDKDDSKQDRLLKELAKALVYALSFSEGNVHSFDLSLQTNFNEVYSLMATIIEVIKDFIKRGMGNVDLLFFTGIKGKKDRNDISKRAKLYQAYIKKNIKLIPGATYEIKKDSTIIVLNKKWKEHTEVVFEISATD